MTATNHALTGAFIGISLHNPIVAVVAAFLSHFVCDTLPHFGAGKEFIRTRAFRIMLITDGLLCIALVMALASYRPEHWLLAAMCAFVATTPDLWNIREFQRALQHRPYPYGRIKCFVNWIQWFERPSGAIVEIAWAAGMLILLVHRA